MDKDLIMAILIFGLPILIIVIILIKYLYGENQYQKEWERRIDELYWLENKIIIEEEKLKKKRYE